MTIIETLVHSVRFRIRILVRLNNETGVQGVPGLLWSVPRIVAMVLF